jgi:hypothetical protein
MISVRSAAGSSLRALAIVASVAVVASSLAVSGAARADEECPLGSVQKSESGETWCEPSVCDDTAPCPNGLLCRPVSLCVEIGVLPQAPGTKSDAGQRLLARQRCGAGKSCPQRTTCSDKSRCITRAEADRANLLSVPGAGVASSASAGAGTATAGATSDAPKKACGCDLVGRSTNDLGAVALALLGVVTIVARRRRIHGDPGATKTTLRGPRSRHAGP